MLRVSTLLLALSVVGSVTAAPTQLDKRIAQVISDSTTKWEQACEAAKGGSQCSTIAVSAAATLLAGGGDCDQQNSADAMMDLSKKLASSDMISLTQIFAQQPRNTPNSLSVRYCQQAPKNAELKGLFQCQFQGASLTQFVGGLAVGKPGTIPFGQSSPVNPPGGCPAHTSGPITAGSQLNSIVSSPGVPSRRDFPIPRQLDPSVFASIFASALSHPAALPSISLPLTLSISFVPTPTALPDTAFPSAFFSGFSQGLNNPTAVPRALPYRRDAGDGSISSSASSSATTSFSASSVVAASSAASQNIENIASPAATPSQSAAALGGDFRSQNGQDAQALTGNQKFRSLTADSSCTDGEQACVNGQFAQCSGGKFSLSPCAGGLTCQALPLVNKPGTSVACDSQVDATARVAAAQGSK